MVCLHTVYGSSLQLLPFWKYLGMMTNVMWFSEETASSSSVCG